MPYHILIVDNDPLQCRTLELAVHKMYGYRTTSLNGGQVAIDFLKSPKGRDVDLMILDLSMPEIDGMMVLQEVKPFLPDLPIIIYTSHGDIQKAVDALAKGALDFVEKKDDPERIRVSIENALKIKKLNHEVKRLERVNNGSTSFNDIIGDSPAIKNAKMMAEKSAESNIPVLLLGESGVGKELFAKSIHGASTRVDKPFIAVNCGAIPVNLVESTLFGHVKGAFTGAISDAKGKFREANGGTLFLDEVGELPLDIQVKLLRALQQKEVEPVGSAAPMKIDVRIISATNRDLKDEVANGNFREDLFYRLNVFPITIPPLNKRDGDIEQITNHFCKTISLHENKDVKGVTKEAKILLEKYPWPGNIRQLENVIYRAIVLSNNEILNEDDFSQIMNGNGNGANNHKNHNNGKCISIIDESGKFKTLSNIEYEAITAALEYHNWHISEVSRQLDVGRSTLYRKMEEMGINPKQEKIRKKAI